MGISPETKIRFSRNGKPTLDSSWSQFPELLREELVLPSDHYWIEGMPDWAKVEELNLKVAEEKRSESVSSAIQELASLRLIAVTTTPTVQGYRVSHYLGIARGVVVRTPNIFEGFGGAVGKALGGRVSAYIGMCEKTRKEAQDAMITSALSLGANAIVGVAYNANPVMEDCTEVLCYGTAVVLEPE
jgi:uncharacterized protein YbjQ (UPF0145 family)